MLKRFRVQGFRSCQDVTLDNLGYVTALIGHNGSGKTNQLQAIEFFAQFAANVDDASLHSSTTQPTSEFEADIALNSNVYRYTIKWKDDKGTLHASPYYESLTFDDGSGDKPIIVRKESNVSLLESGEQLLVGISSSFPALWAILPSDHSLKQRHLAPLLDFLKSIRFYPLDEAYEARDIDRLGILWEDAYWQWTSRRHTVATADDSVLWRLLDAWIIDRNAFDEICHILGPKGLRLIEDIVISTLEGRPSVSDQRGFNVLFMLHSTDQRRRLHRFDQLSLGTRRIIRLIVSLVLDDSSVMLIEHPEDGIHRGLVKKLIDLISSYANPKQVILSTHSTTVMNALQPADIRLVTIENGSTQVRPLSPKEVALAENYINEEGSLAEFIETVEG
jgi:predicted ATPase